MKIFVKKLNGELELFNESKLRRSLQRAGADNKTIDLLMERVRKMLYNGIETKTLFSFVFDEFKKIAPGTSSKYSLKNAIMNLGKEGYVFEKFVSKIFEKKGYSTNLNQEIGGKFISHEIDVSARKGKETILVECKYHRNPWLGCSIQTALYVYARFLDLEKKFNKAMLVTNTKFSSQVIKYSKGVGLGLMGWRYPPNDSLEKNIEKFNIYPVTVIYQLNQKAIKNCLSHSILTVEDFVEANPSKLSALLAINKQKVKNIQKKAKELI